MPLQFYLTVFTAGYFSHLMEYPIEQEQINFRLTHNLTIELVVPYSYRPKYPTG
jgi:hypothetical protein